MRANHPVIDGRRGKGGTELKTRGISSLLFFPILLKTAFPPLNQPSTVIGSRVGARSYLQTFPAKEFREVLK